MKKFLLAIFLLQSFLIHAGALAVNSSNTDSKKIYLISVTNGSLSLVDSVLTTKQQYTFPDHTAGYYTFKIVYPGSTTNIPTYYGNKAFWDQADSIYLGPQLWDTTLTSLTTILGVTYSGMGSISGSISHGTAKLAAGGTGYANIEVLLLDGSGVPVTYTNTDVNGNYQFTNLPFGTYKVYAESPGIYNSTVPTVNLSSGTPTASGVSITMNKTVQTTAITKALTKQFNCYPNPVKDVLKIDLLSKATGLELLTIDGRKVITMEIENLNEVNLSTIDRGIYYLKVISLDGSFSVEKIIKE